MTQTRTAPQATDHDTREWYFAIQHHLNIIDALLAKPVQSDGKRMIGVRVQLGERLDALQGALRLARKQGVDIQHMP